jgi:hypothetical protein
MRSDVITQMGSGHLNTVPVDSVVVVVLLLLLRRRFGCSFSSLFVTSLNIARQAQRQQSGLSASKPSHW